MLETICDIMTDAYKRNWITSRDGNVSIRHHDRDHFYITPSGVRKQTLQPDQFKKIGIAADKKTWHLLEYTDISHKLNPSGEIPLHFGLQKQMGQHHGEVRVVVHVHPPLLYLYPVWIAGCLIYGWASWTRGSFGMLANYVLLVTIDSVGLINMLLK